MTWYEPEDLGRAQRAHDQRYGRNEFWVYILETDYGHYIGHTADYEDRLARHNAGLVRSTAGGNPGRAWVRKKPFRTRNKAARYEAMLKSWRDFCLERFKAKTGLDADPWRGWDARVEEPRNGSFSSRRAFGGPAVRRRFSDSRGPEGVFRRSRGVAARGRKSALAVVIVNVCRWVAELKN